MISGRMQSSEPSNDLEKNLHDDEEFHWSVRPDRKARFASKVTTGLVGLLIVGIMIAVVAYTQTNSTILAVLGFVVPVGLHVGNAFLGMYLDNIEYAATDQRLLDYRGRFGRSLDSVPFDGIQDAEYNISAVENFFDVGTVTVDTDRGYERITFQQAPDPQQFTRDIVSLADQSGSGSEQTETNGDD
jgi:hypothetical protein